MNLLQKKKMKSNFQKMKSSNDEFINFVELLRENGNLEEKFILNIDLLKNHLENMNVVFTQMIDSVSKK